LESLQFGFVLSTKNKPLQKRLSRLSNITEEGLNSIKKQFRIKLKERSAQVKPKF
jgi:hypothetical protein